LRGLGLSAAAVSVSLGLLPTICLFFVVFRLRADLEDMQQRCAEAEGRCQELSSAVPQSTRPLLRQIESLQAGFAEKQAVWEQVMDPSLLSSISFACLLHDSLSLPPSIYPSLIFPSRDVIKDHAICGKRLLRACTSLPLISGTSRSRFLVFVSVSRDRSAC